jgi:hypothetical protein
VCDLWLWTLAWRDERERHGRRWRFWWPCPAVAEVPSLRPEGRQAASAMAGDGDADGHVRQYAEVPSLHLAGGKIKQVRLFIMFFVLVDRGGRRGSKFPVHLWIHLSLL